MQEIEIWPYEHMAYAQPISGPGKWDEQTPLGFWHTNGSPYLGQTARAYNDQQKKRTCRIVDFAVLAEHKVKLKGSEKHKYFDLIWELKKLWNMKVKVIPNVVGALGRVTKDLVKAQEDEWKQSKLQHCWDRPKYSKESCRPKVICHSNSHK